MTTEVPMNYKCLNCGEECDRATSFTSDDGPEPGDITICLYCGKLMAFANDLSLRPLTSNEVFITENDPVIVEMKRAREEVMRYVKNGKSK